MVRRRKLSVCCSNFLKLPNDKFDYGLIWRSKLGINATLLNQKSKSSLFDLTWRRRDTDGFNSLDYCFVSEVVEKIWICCQSQSRGTNLALTDSLSKSIVNRTPRWLSYMRQMISFILKVSQYKLWMFFHRFGQLMDVQIVVCFQSIWRHF